MPLAMDDLEKMEHVDIEGLVLDLFPKEEKIALTFDEIADELVGDTDRLSGRVFVNQTFTYSRRMYKRLAFVIFALNGLVSSGRIIATTVVAKPNALEGKYTTYFHLP